jgi:hypothetical protein
MINCQTLAAQIQKIEPTAEVREVARLCLLLCNSVDSLEELEDQQHLEDAWREMSLRLQAATDQHAAMTEELEALARSDPDQFSKEQIWVLIRAIKVQSQILQLYVGEPALDI